MSTISTSTKIGNSIFAFFCISIAFYAFAYLFIDFPFLASKGKISDQMLWQVAFHMHFIGGGVALGLGWIQFLKGFRNKNINIHRTLGKIYISSIILVSAPGGMYLATLANGGFNNMMGFGMMAICWFTCTSMAYVRIRQSDVSNHEKWMIRSFALTLAAVTLRIEMPIMIISGINPEEAYQAIAWFCWVPNLMVAEWIIGRKR